MAHECPVSRSDFRRLASVAVVTVEGKPFSAPPKTFSTNSLGFHTSGKTEIMVGGVPCRAQVNVLITLVGSKELP
jgi:hypothetical protein